MKLSQLAQSVFSLNGKSFSLKNREVYHIFFNNKTQNTLLYTGRQVAKSTNFSAMETLGAQVFDGFGILHIAPYMQQLRPYAQSRLHPLIRQAEQSPLLGQKRIGRALMDVYFENDSRIHLRGSLLDADSARGLSCDWLFFDETQDLIGRNISIIKECASASEHPEGFRFFYAGTPKTSSNTMDALFQAYTTLEPMVLCSHCNKYNYIGYDNITKEGFLCLYCKQVTDHKKFAMCITNRRSDNSYALRIPQVIMQPWNRIWDKKIDPMVPVAVFYNECLALPYSIGTRPITKEQLMKISTGDFLHSNATMPNCTFFAGLDPGYGSPSNSVLTIGGYFPSDTKFHIVFYEKMNSVIVTGAHLRRQCEHIALVLRAFNISLILIDHGSGLAHMTELSKNPLLRVYSMMHVHKMKEMLRFEPECNRFKSYRTQTMQKCFQDLNDDIIELPRGCESLHQDFLNVFAEPDKMGNLTFNHLQSEPDDCFHSFLYCYFLALLYFQRIPSAKYYFA
jgi:hypothetical protein